MEGKPLVQAESTAAATAEATGAVPAVTEAKEPAENAGPASKLAPEEDERAHLTPRELAVLRLVSLGRTTEDAAKLLGLGEETVRSHLKKAQAKLGALNRAHAASEAIRQQLIP